MDLLRALVTVADLGGITRAGEALGRSQPAISLQIKRLESLLDTELFRRDGRQLQLTDSGTTLIRYARQILSLNDNAIAQLTQRRVSGSIRLGIPNEFAGSYLPEILGRFAESQPEVTLEVGCELSNRLLARLAKKEFDLVLGLHAERRPAGTDVTWPEEVVWLTSARHASYSKSPLPLIVAPDGCVYRHRMVEALDRAGINWRIAYTSPTLGGIRAGVMAGIGVTAMARRTVPQGLELISAAMASLPRLKPVEAALHFDSATCSPAVLRLVEFMSNPGTPG